MIFRKGNLLEEKAEALVNTVNAVGVMGKGIALMFKEAYPDNFAAYRAACKAGEVRPGGLFVYRRDEFFGPRLIINFVTKNHWRHPSRIEWIEQGLESIVQLVREEGIHSIALPPLGAGNGGLDWGDVLCLIKRHLAGLDGVDVIVYEPTKAYQNVSKREGMKQLTPARAVIAELVRCYEVLGFECTLLETQKLAWFAERWTNRLGLQNQFDLRFNVGHYGPYSDRLRHFLNRLDGSYLHSDIRIPDARPFDVVRFRYDQAERIRLFLETTVGEGYGRVVEKTEQLIDGFEAPYGLELLATVDWLLFKENCEPRVDALLEAIASWPTGRRWGKRKSRIFDRRVLGIALEHLQESKIYI